MPDQPSLTTALDLLALAAISAIVAAFLAPFAAGGPVEILRGSLRRALRPARSVSTDPRYAKTVLCGPVLPGIRAVCEGLRPAAPGLPVAFPHDSLVPFGYHAKNGAAPWPATLPLRPLLPGPAFSGPPLRSEFPPLRGRSCELPVIAMSAIEDFDAAGSVAGRAVADDGLEAADDDVEAAPPPACDKPRKALPWSSDEIDLLEELWLSDLSRSEIAAELGRSMSAVSVQATRMGLGARSAPERELLPMRSCNICRKAFRPSNTRIRFCNPCRSGEQYRSGDEWIISGGPLTSSTD